MSLGFKHDQFKEHGAMATCTLLCFWLFCFFQAHWFCFILCMLFLLVYKIYNHYMYTFVFLAVLYSLMMSVTFDASQGFCGRVQLVGDGHVVLSKTFASLTVFTSKTLFLDDFVCVDGNIQSHRKTNHFIEDPWTLFAYQNASIGTYSGTVSLIRRARTLYGTLYRSVTLSNRVWILSMLFSQPLPVRSIIGGFFIQSGLHLSFFFRTLKQILGFFMYQKKTMSILLIFLFVFAYVWQWNLVVCRWILNMLLLLFCSKLRFRFFYVYGITLLFFPMSYRSLAWLIPCLFSIANTHQIRGWEIRYFLLPWLQLASAYRFSLLTFLFFPLLRFISGWMYVFAWVALMCKPLGLLFERVVEAMVSVEFEHVLFAGKPTWWMMLIILFSVFHHNRIKTKLMIQLSMIGVLVLSFWAQPWATVTYFNVGQGNATLIQLPFNQGNFMIDVARNRNQALITKTLFSKGITYLDAVFITHDDADHAGGLQRLSETMPLGKIIDHKEDVQIGPLYVTSFLKQYQGIDDNDHSLVLGFTLGDCSFLFTGDLYRQGEKEFLKNYYHLTFDTILLGHHGSKTSSDFDFLASIQPKLAVVSSDPAIYGHPHTETLKTLYQLRIPFVQTSASGDIRVLVLGKFQLLLSSSRQFGIIKCR